MGVKISWNGLVSLMLSLSYCKYHEKVVAEIWTCANHKRIKSQWRLHVDFDYTTFLNGSEISELQKQSIVPIPQEELAEAYRDREAYKIKRKAEQEQKFKDLLRKRPPDSSFENVAAPKTWRPCYMSGKYTPKDIETHLKQFVNLLGIDAKKSTVITDFLEQIPDEYEIYPAKYQG